MRFSFDWLKRHLVTDLDIRQIADRLTSIGLEVESIENPSENFRNFKLVQIGSIEKHPNADTLNVCMANDAQGKKMKIVCGAKNVRVGLKTVLAMPGAIIPASHEVLKKSKIRGIESEGMMCSPSELSLSLEKNGIIEICDTLSLSTSVGEALGYSSGTIDLSITSNRGDCFSVKGIARDLAAAGAGSFSDSQKATCKSSFKFPMKIKCDGSDSCMKYAPIIAFRVIRNVKNGDSPQWLKSLLQSSGMKSISAIVDLANWYMVDAGRPLHIYDMNKIKGDISIRFAKNKEKFVDLKNIEHQLQGDMLVCADLESPLCLMGIMGGAKVACDENTTDILIESGLFDPVFVSKTGAFLNLLSDSRAMFERGIDRASCVPGIEEVSKLIMEHCGGEASDIFVVGQEPKSKRKISLRKEKLLSISGCEIDWDAAKLILKKLGLSEISSTQNEITYSVPNWRSDLNIEEDLVEEIMRLVGYESISEKRIEDVAVGTDKILNEKKRLTAAMRLLASCGLSEVISYSFMKKDYAEVFREDKTLISLINPITTDLNVMRPSLIPNLLLTAKRSLNYGQSSVEICESGNVFYDSCLQELHISGLRAGVVNERNWLQKSRPVDVFDIKADLFVLLKYLGIKLKSSVIEFTAPSYYHPSRSGTILVGKKKLGYFGELHPKINKLFNISENLVCFELLCSSLLGNKNDRQTYIPKVFPKIIRDFAFVFDANTAVGNIINDIYKLDSRIVKTDIFDCFSINGSKKSVGISVTLDAIDRTLTENEAQEVSEKILKYVNTIGGELRTR